MTLKLNYELKKQLTRCEIYQIGEKSYNIQDLINNYYSEILVRNALNVDSNKKYFTTIISDEDFIKNFRKI